MKPVNPAAIRKLERIYGGEKNIALRRMYNLTLRAGDMLNDTDYQAKERNRAQETKARPILAQLYKLDLDEGMLSELRSNRKIKVRSLQRILKEKLRKKSVAKKADRIPRAQRERPAVRVSTSNSGGCGQCMAKCTKIQQWLGVCNSDQWMSSQCTNVGFFMPKTDVVKEYIAKPYKDKNQYILCEQHYNYINKQLLSWGGIAFWVATALLLNALVLYQRGKKLDSAYQHFQCLMDNVRLSGNAILNLLTRIKDLPTQVLEKSSGIIANILNAIFQKQNDKFTDDYIKNSTLSYLITSAVIILPLSYIGVGTITSIIIERMDRILRAVPIGGDIYMALAPGLREKIDEVNRLKVRLERKKKEGLEEIRKAEQRLVINRK